MKEMNKIKKWEEKLAYKTMQKTKNEKRSKLSALHKTRTKKAKNG